MSPLRESLTMFTLAGVWRPSGWSKISAQLYRFYTLFALCLIYSLTFSELMGAFLLTRSLEEFTEISFLLLSTVSVCCKATSIIIRRARVNGLLDELGKIECTAHNSCEAEILLKFNRITRYLALGCISLAETTVAVMSTGPLVQKQENRTLPFKTWLPYEVTPGTRYFLSYIHQTVAIFLCATINVANDTLLCGFMIQVYSQLELLSNRLLELPKIVRSTKTLLRNLEASIVAQHIRHHNLIFRFTKNVNEIFKPIIVVQFCMSSIVLSLTVYQLSVKRVNGIQFLTLILYLSCMLVQFFMYCWFGNEVTLKVQFYATVLFLIQSLEFGQAIYNTDWISLRLQTMKSLIIMMLRARQPIVISCSSLITLSIKSFLTILKTSYSAFNLLLRSSS